MAYLVQDDFKTRIRQSEFSQLIDDSTEVLDKAVDEVESVFRDYLLPTYNVDTIFQASGNERNPHLIMHMVHYVIYILYQRLPELEIPEVIENNYQDSKDYMLKISQGKYDMNLPRMTDDEGKVETVFRGGSDPARVISDRVL